MVCGVTKGSEVTHSHLHSTNNQKGGNNSAERCNARKQGPHLSGHRPEIILRIGGSRRPPPGPADHKPCCCGFLPDGENHLSCRLPFPEGPWHQRSCPAV